MVDFGRLVQPSGGHRPRVEDEHCDYGFDNMEPSFTPAATPTDSTNPIDIPLRLDKEEPDSALQEVCSAYRELIVHLSRAILSVSRCLEIVFKRVHTFTREHQSA